MQAKLSAVTFSLSNQQGHAGAIRHADRRHRSTVRLGVRRQGTRRLGEALGPRHGDVASVGGCRTLTTFLDVAGAEKSFGAATVLGGVDLGSRRASSSRCSVRPAAASRPCCASSPASSRRRGTVTLDGEDITRKPPHRRDVGVVFQNYALFPHLTVAENVAFGLKARRRARRRRRRVKRFLELVHLAGFADRRCARFPAASSSGWRWRARSPFGPSSCCSTSRSRPSTQAARDHADRAATAAARARHDGGLRDPRPARGADHVGPHRGDEPRRHRAVRHAGGDLPPPETAFVLEFVGLSSRLAGKVVGRPMPAWSPSIPRSAGCSDRAASSPARRRAGRAAQRITVDRPGDNGSRRLRDAVFQGSKVQLHFASPDGTRLLVETADLPDGLPSPGSAMQLALGGRRHADLSRAP